MSTDLCQICCKECTPWKYIIGHICQDCAFVGTENNIIVLRKHLAIRVDKIKAVEWWQGDEELTAGIKINLDDNCFYNLTYNDKEEAQADFEKIVEDMELN